MKHILFLIIISLICISCEKEKQIKVKAIECRPVQLRFTYLSENKDLILIILNNKDTLYKFDKSNKMYENINLVLDSIVKVPNITNCDNYILRFEINNFINIFYNTCYSGNLWDCSFVRGKFAVGNYQDSSFKKIGNDLIKIYKK